MFQRRKGSFVSEHALRGETFRVLAKQGRKIARIDSAFTYSAMTAPVVPR